MEAEIDRLGTLVRDSERRSRWIEVILSVFASAATSAVVVSWSLSSTLTSLASSSAEHERAISSQQAQLTTLIARSMSVGERQATTDARYEEIQRRLKSIDDKLERAR